MPHTDQVSPATGLLLAGGYTVPGVAPGAKATGISTLALTPDGAVIVLETSLVGPNPTFLCASADGNTVYTTNEDYAANGAGKSLAFAPNAAEEKKEERNRATQTSFGALKSDSFGPRAKKGGQTVDPRGKLGPTEAQGALDSGGSGCCHAALDLTGAHIIFSNYMGNIGEKGFKDGLSRIYALEEGGAVGAMTCELQLPTPAQPTGCPARQADGVDGCGAHSHMAAFRKDSLYICDLGNNCVWCYAYDSAAGTASGALSSCALPPGAGPRHLAFHPTLPVAYVVAEMASTVTTVAIADDGALSVAAGAAPLCTLPGEDGRDYEYRPADGTFLKDFAKTAAEGEDQWSVNSACAAIRVSPSAKHVLASNRGHDSLAVFAVDAATGALSKSGVYPSGGKTPRDFIFVNDALVLVANQDSDSVSALIFDSETGKLTAGPTSEVPTPNCLLLLREGRVEGYDSGAEE